MDGRVLIIAIVVFYIQEQESLQSKECVVQLLKYRWYKTDLSDRGQVDVCDHGFHFEVEPLPMNKSCYDHAIKNCGHGSCSINSSFISKDMFCNNQKQFNMQNLKGYRFKFATMEEPKLWVLRVCSDNPNTNSLHPGISFWCQGVNSDEQRYTINQTTTGDELQLNVTCSSISRRKRLCQAQAGNYSINTVPGGSFENTTPLKEDEGANMNLEILIPVSIVVVGLIAPLILIIYQKKYRS